MDSLTSGFSDNGLTDKWILQTTDSLRFTDKGFTDNGFTDNGYTDNGFTENEFTDKWIH